MYSNILDMAYKRVRPVMGPMLDVSAGSSLPSANALGTHYSTFFDPYAPQGSAPSLTFALGEEVTLTQDLPILGPTGTHVKVIETTPSHLYRVVNSGNNTFWLMESQIAKLWTIKVKKIKPKKPKISMDSVVLSPEKKELIHAAISQIKYHNTIFNKWGFGETFEKGTAVSLLFWGIPGTGKTLMAQAIAEELNYELKIYGTAEIQSSEPGGAERAIQSIFKQANEINRATEGKKRLILLDECDSLLTDRNEMGPILGAEINCLLGELERYTGVIIFTTNRLGKLDPALERRLSTKIEFTFPTKPERVLIWQRMFPKKAPLKDIDFVALAEHALAGGNIKNAVLQAARLAAHRKSKTITHEHLDEAIAREKAFLKAFIQEYQSNPHHPMHGYVTNTGRGLKVKRTTETEQSLRGDNT